MDYEFIKDFLPWFLGIAVTVAAWFKDNIKSAFTKESDLEDLETKQLSNKDTELEIYKGILDDLQVRYRLLTDQLKDEIVELAHLVASQKELIVKQSRSLDYYERKYGKIINKNKNQ